MSSVDKDSTRALMAFVRAYIDGLEQNLQAVHETMRTAVDGVMKGISEISSKSLERQKAANDVLVATGTAPGDETTAASGADDEAELSGLADPAAAGMLRRQLLVNPGLLQKHMQALNSLDENLQIKLLEMMGMLSNDDVIAQRLAHVQQGLNALQASLTYILTDFEVRCRQGEVDRFVRDLKSFTLRTYTMEDERAVFYRCFPADRPPNKKKAS